MNYSRESRASGSNQTLIATGLRPRAIAHRSANEHSVDLFGGARLDLIDDVPHLFLMIGPRFRR